MQPPTRKRSRKGLWIALGVIAGLLVVCGAGGVGLFAYAVAQAARPLQVATAFCADLKTQEYSSAYTLLSKAYQAQVTEAAYVQTAQLHDQVDGTVQSCGLQTADSGGFTFDFNRNTATVAAQIVRKTAVSGTIALVEEASMWKIARLDASLQGTDVGPLATANDFCHALASANYAASWRDFSSRYQSKNPEATYVSRIKQAIAAASQQAGGTVKYDGCKHDLSTYQVAADDASASLSSALIVQDAAQSVELPIKLAFIMEASSWKIDSITNATA